MNSHTNKFLCGVDGCQYRAGDCHHLIRHKRQMHSNEQLIESSPKDAKRGLKTKKGICVLQDMYHKSIENYSQKTNASKVFRCEWRGCSQVCLTRVSLNYHKNRHSGKYLCNIDGCDYKAGVSYDLLRHKQRKHINEKPFKCSVGECETRFSTGDNLRKHQISYHKFVAKVSTKQII